MKRILPLVVLLMISLSLGCAHRRAAKGSYENPLTRAEEEEKALDLVVPILGEARSRELVAQLWNFEQLADVSALRPLYQR